MLHVFINLHIGFLNVPLSKPACSGHYKIVNNCYPVLLNMLKTCASCTHVHVIYYGVVYVIDSCLILKLFSDHGDGVSQYLPVHDLRKVA